MKDAVQIAIPIPSDEIFYYSAPKGLENGIEIGKRVLVPFQNRKALGFILGTGLPPQEITLKDIIDIVDEEPLFDDKRLEFLKWISKYYLAPLGTVLKVAHPGGLGLNLRRLIKITDKGKRFIDKKNIDEKQHSVLRTLSINGDITAGKLIDLFTGITQEYLNALRRKNLIEYDYELKSSYKVKLEKIIKPNKDIQIDQKFEKRYPAKFKILDFLITHDSVPYADLKEVFGQTSGHVRWLEDNGFITIDAIEVKRDPYSEFKISTQKPPELTPEQSVACRKLWNAINRIAFSPFLLHGVTGSGKTEIYLRVIDQVIKKGREAIVLVPEISLTPQLVKRFRGRFGKLVAVIHSALSDGQRFDAWRMASRGEVKIVIGARSAIFAPFKNVGVIVVDEEHESSYKQDEMPCYNSRDLSLVLGKMMNAVVVLGSATPSVESYANSLKEKFTLLSLPLRVKDRSLPEVEIVDMRNEGEAVISKRLSSEIKKNFMHKKQTILFLNRRGFSNLLICQACGAMVSCPNCSITLTYHSKGQCLRCHYCGISEPLFENCLKCGSLLLRLGVGTQKIEEEVKRLIPSVTVARMDRDAVSGKNRLLQLYKRLESGEIDVLIGTQMVAKGHDLPGVTLVGVVASDISLGIPDFRSGERTFQLITQVAGRAGRGNEDGRVIVQTFNPDHPSIKYAIEQDSIGFLNDELKLRGDLEYPPFSRLVNVKFQGRIESETADYAKSAYEVARKIVSKLPVGSINILGPSESPVYKIRNRFRWQMLLKSPNLNLLHNYSKKLMQVLTKMKTNKNLKVIFDVDPLSFN